MKGDVCPAHNLLVENVNYIRGKQDDTNATVQVISVKQNELGLQIVQIQDSQKEIMRMLKRRRWTTAKITALCAALFGSGSAFPSFVTFIVTKVAK